MSALKPSPWDVASYWFLFLFLFLGWLAHNGGN